jgi:small-conductance mechanosensitive channel
VDPGIEALLGLRRELQRDAALHERLEEVRTALAEEDRQISDPARPVVGGEPPYSITLLDQLLAERHARAVAEDAAERRLDNARRRVNEAVDALATAVTERRAARDRLLEAQDRADEPDLSPSRLAGLELALEARRIEQLGARRHHAAAQTRVAVASAEQALAAAEQRLLDVKIAQIQDQVVLTEDMLHEQLAELVARAEDQRGELERLRRMGETAESALYEAQRRIDDGERTVGDAARESLNVWVDARTAEVTTARKGVEYVQQTLDELAAMEQPWRRRHRVLANPDDAAVVDWLRQPKRALATLRKDQDYVEAELNALRDLQLKLRNRLNDPAVAAGVREPLLLREAALNERETHARALLAAQEERRTLLARLSEELEPLASARSLEMRAREALDRLSDWWAAELFAIGDQGVSVRDLTVTLGIFLLVLVVVSLAKRVLKRLLLRGSARDRGAPLGKVGLLLDAIAEHTNGVVVLIAAFVLALALSGLARPLVEQWLFSLLVVALYVQLGLWVNAALTDYLMRKRSRMEREDPSAVTGYGLLLLFVKAGVWIIVGISVLAYFKYPIAGLIGALGVGGIAVAFAVQSILGDVFNSMAIILDKPFRVGDFVIAGDTLGVVERIGVKTTRIRSLSGEQVILSNTDLLNAAIRSFKHMRERRVVFRLAVTYEPPREKLERIPRLIEDSIREQDRVRFDRAHFFEYGDYALLFEAVHYVLGPDYNLYMDLQQAINFAIHRRFETERIDFAYPTREIILCRPEAARANAI